MSDKQLNPLAKYLVHVYEEKETSPFSPEGIHVNPIVSEVASWYEKVRNAMDYRDEEVVLRAAIERILKRRHFYGGTGKTIAQPLLRELIWARYFPDGSISDATVEKTEHVINLYLELRKKILVQHKISELEVNKFTYYLLSSQLTYLLDPSHQRDVFSNFMYHAVHNSITIEDDAQETCDAQVFIATRRAFAKDDQALLFYHLFLQYFGQPTPENLDNIAHKFMNGYKTIMDQLNYPLRFRIFGFVKRNTAPFFILEEVLRKNKDNLSTVIHDDEKLKQVVYEICKEKYSTIRSKVNRAIIRSLIFVLLTKTIIAFSVEGTVENMLYGHVSWGLIALNISIPPVLLILASLFIKTPGDENTERIYKRIRALLFDEEPHVKGSIKLRRYSRAKKSLLYFIFSFLWFAAFILSFGIIIFILTQVHFNFISQTIFIFYLTIIAFLIYRIYRTAHSYSVERKQTLLTPVVDFFFMPLARVGRHLTESVSHFNIFLFILDFLIEAPFKGLFAFFEQLFMFLHSKREYLD